MLRAENTVTIRKPAPEVFAFVTDGMNAPKWRSGVLDIERVTGSGGVGTRYRQGVKGPGGRRVAADYEVTEYEADRLLAFPSHGRPRPSPGMVLETIHDDCPWSGERADDLTRVTWTNVHVCVRWIKNLWPGAVAC